MNMLATIMPVKIGLKACARFRRRVAVSRGPIDSMYGFALVSRKARPNVRM
jgi:hypothetical protein